jgi:hypothetical protein
MFEIYIDLYKYIYYDLLELGVEEFVEIKYDQPDELDKECIHVLCCFMTKNKSSKM